MKLNGFKQYVYKCPFTHSPKHGTKHEARADQQSSGYNETPCFLLKAPSTQHIFIETLNKLN